MKTLPKELEYYDFGAVKKAIKPGTEGYKAVQIFIKWHELNATAAQRIKLKDGCEGYQTSFKDLKQFKRSDAGVIENKIYK